MSVFESNAEATSAADGDDIPVYRIDLSLPPAERYTQLATEYGPKMRALTPLYDEVLSIIVPNDRLRGAVNFLATMLLRRVYSQEETLELRGISSVSGVEMYLLVAFNVLLDTLLGCTSGGVMVRPRSGPERMMHFRTLDWGMDELRDLLVVLEFVRSDGDDPEMVVARTVTYAGFTGVLTGVRQGLSLSLNFRPTHICSVFSLRIHQLLIISGIRPSIASILRSRMYESKFSKKSDITPRQTLDQTSQTLARIRSAPCYLILCDGSQTIVVEKDLATSDVRSSREFLVHTNHDVGEDDSDGRPRQQNTLILGMEAWVEESEERWDCMQRRWNRHRNRHVKSQNLSTNGSNGEAKTVKSTPGVSHETLIKWVKSYPIMNSCTHFACILDPETAQVSWLKRGSMDSPEP